ncbi:hypothetical protein LCGC14_0228600 [marine sediment metagenome]|uniref:Uncharacterized protein n=1 Tax=marine sediment metagenome TaxID=412755 RepID=A0A0F9WVS0_9ZZZZ
MSTLVLRPHTHQSEAMALLCIRNHDLGGVDYERVARLSLDQAASVLAGTRWGDGRSAIGSHFPDEHFDGSATPGRLTVVPRPDPQLNTRNFIMHLAKEDSEPEQIGYISADMLHDLQGMRADVAINVTEEDFKAVEDALTRLKVAQLRRQADELEATLDTPEQDQDMQDSPGISLDEHSPQAIAAICAKNPSQIDASLKEAYGDRVAFESSTEEEFGRGNFTITVDGGSVLAGAYDNYCTTSSMKYDVGQMFTNSRKQKLEFMLEAVWVAACASHRPEGLIEEKMSALDSLDM